LGREHDLTDYRAWWLRRLGDEEIAAASCFMEGIPVRPEHVENVGKARALLRGAEGVTLARFDGQASL
jgi:hypothetical protein